jgi:signal transduction histidine kinase
MKTIEFTPDGKPTITPALPPVWDESCRNDMLRELLPVVFHKLKNHLTPILGYAQILQSRTEDDFFKDRLGRIERNSVVLSEAFNTLKEYFKPAPAALQPADLNLILEGLADRWQKIADAEGTRIVLELDTAIPEAALDAGQIRFLLLSMVENACQALKGKEAPEREIRLTTSVADSRLKLAIRDNGRGMSAEEMAGIWAPFHSNFPDHAGLGLVLCEKIIANHNAACSVTSLPGEFSRFEIAFPAAGKQAQSQEKSVEADSRSQATKEVP